MLSVVWLEGYGRKSDLGLINSKVLKYNKYVYKDI